MKSILLTSSSSSSPSTPSTSSFDSQVSINLSLPPVESKKKISRNDLKNSCSGDDDDSKDESAFDSVVDKRQYKLLAFASKSQVIKRKSLTRDGNDDDDDKLLICEDLCSNNNNNNNKKISSDRWSMENNQSVVNDDDDDNSFALKLESHLIDNIEFENDESDNQARRKINVDAINPSSTSKLLSLRKKNGTSLVFQRKNCSPQQQHYQELEAERLSKRQSFHWPYKGVVTSHNGGNKFNKSRHYSWYDDACNYTRQPIEEEYENSSLTQFQRNEHSNLAEIKTIIASSLLSINSASEENVPENSSIRMKTSIDNNNSAPSQSKRWHNIEQFLKSLVGKRSSSSQVSTSTVTTTTTSSTAAVVNKSPSAYDFLQQKPSTCGSTISLNNKERLINKSTASLNSTSLTMVHQKLWSVVPLLSRKDGIGGGASCNNLLSNGNSTPMHGKMRKCETVLALTDEPTTTTSSRTCNRQTHSKSINNLLDPIPMRPLNRLRNSQSCYVNCDPHQMRYHQSQNCSGCSSLLSLAAIGGSSYSLTNGAFVLKNGKHSSARHVKLREEELVVTKEGSSNHNLIDNDYNTIEPYDTNDAIKAALATSSSSKGYGKGDLTKFTCKLCLGEYFNEDKLTTIASCGCTFCTECMRTYIEFEISEGAYELSCPDALCSSQGVLSLDEISQLTSPSLVSKHHRYRLNREVELDKNRLWCPNRNCETICSIPTIEKLSPSTSSQSAFRHKEQQQKSQQQPSSSTATLILPRSVLCPTCSLEFCSSCKKAWHPSITCDENSKRLGNHNDSMMFFDNDLIKNCPMCAVPIEKDEGCAQMMCKRCKHVFCWYCLASLDDDFLLRHYDKGPCKNKLGHSRASVVWHRAQVIGIFAGFGILLLVASPLLLLAAPCIVCCKCKIEESTTANSNNNNNKIDEPDGDHQV